MRTVFTTYMQFAVKPHVEQQELSSPTWTCLTHATCTKPVGVVAMCLFRRSMAPDCGAIRPAQAQSSGSRDPSFMSDRGFLAQI